MPRLVQRKQRADRERRLGALAVEVLTALGERDGAVRDAERRAGFRRGLLVALIRPVTGHGHPAQLEGQRPAWLVREPDASGAWFCSNSISSCRFMITSTYPGLSGQSRSLRRESHQSRSNQEESQLSTASKKAQYRRRLTLRWSRAGIRVCPTGRRAKLSTGVLRRLSAGFGATSAALNPSLDHPVRSRVLCPMPGKLWTSHPRKVINRFQAKDSGPRVRA